MINFNLPPKSWRASKKLFFKRLYKDIGSLSNVNSLADFGCAIMNLRDNVKVPQYYAIDINQSYLDAGLIKHPDAIVFCDRLQDVNLPNKVDVAVCVETLGITEQFEVEEIVGAIRNMVISVKKGGSFFINIGPTIILTNPLLYEHVREILFSTFETVSIMEYGRFNERIRSWKSRILYNLMVIFPFIRKKPSKPFHYFCCLVKK